MKATLIRLGEEETEARQALAQAENQQNELPDFDHLKRDLDAARLVQSEKRSHLAEARAQAQGLKRETEMRQRRLAAVERERASWITRAQNADAQIATLAARLEETEGEIAALKDRPDDIAEKRRALLSEIAKAETAQREASDQLVSAERSAMEAGLAAKVAMESPWHHARGPHPCR